MERATEGERESKRQRNLKSGEDNNSWRGNEEEQRKVNR